MKKKDVAEVQEEDIPPDNEPANVEEEVTTEDKEEEMWVVDYYSYHVVSIFI